MKTTTIIASLFRFLPASCLALALTLGLLVAPSPALAADEPAAVAAPDRAAEQKALRDEIAERVREKALFKARLAPKLAALFPDSRRSYRYEDPERFLDALWLFRSSPAILDDWLRQLNRPGLSDWDKTELVQGFESFISDTRHLADDLKRRGPGNGNIWTKFRDTYLAAPDTDKATEQADSAYALTAERLREVKDWEAAFADALVLHNALRQADIDRYEIREYAPLLLRLKDRPEDLQLAASLIGNTELSPEKVRALMAKLATEPEAARAEIARAGEAALAEARYLHACNDEGYLDFVLLPLESVLPEAVRAVEKPGVIPLAAYADTKTEKSLSLTRLERLVPDDFPFRTADGKTPAPLPFLQKDERLYIVSEGGPGAHIFTKTPLGLLEYAGPRVLEVTAENMEKVLSPSLRRSHSREFYLVAATCGPEELAAHLGSLGVMSAAREKSLYGPYQDFVRSEQNARWSSNAKRLGGKYPKDMPGEALRLVQTGSAETFLVLAPLADKAGLARLMGPIRGVWAREYARHAPEPWTELRYASKSAKAKPGVLGTDPVLSLNKSALAALVAGHDRLMVQAWVNYTQRECGEAGDALCKEQYPDVLTSEEKKFAAIRAKGFVSPLDMSTALYLLEQYAKDPAKLEALRAVLDDTSLSSAKRIAAMRQIADK